jgi:micrococcal nuclease
MNKPIAIVLLILIMLLPQAFAFPGEISSIVTNVLNGNTIEVQGIGIVRLADVCCLGQGSSGSGDAKAYTMSRLKGNPVSLELSDNPDPQGCRVAVVRLPDGSIFNRMLVDEGYACIWDRTDNCFNPADWWGGQIPATACIKGGSKPVYIPLEATASSSLESAPNSPEAQT